MPNSTPIRVVYDTSVLGFGEYEKTGRTGVFRLVENNVAGLAASHECELAFSASESMQMLVHAYNYLKRNHLLQGHKMLSYGGLASVYRLLESGRYALSQQRQIPSPLRMVRRALSESVQSLDKISQPFDSRPLDKTTVFHSPYWALPKATQGMKARFLTVHDLACINYPEMSDAGGAFLESILASATPKDWFICVSHSTRRDLLAYRRELNPDQVLVIHSAAAERFRPVTDPLLLKAIRAKYRLGAQYFLSVCTLEKRKNLPTMIEAFYHFSQLNPGVELVLAGPSASAADLIRNKMDALGLAPSRVRFIGFVDDADLPALYSDCLAFVYPSYYEGFGFPPLEAMQCGAAVITSNGGSLPEVVGDAGILVSPTDTKGFAEALHQMATSSGLRLDYRRRALAQALNFSWKKNTQELLRAYAKALAN